MNVSDEKRCLILKMLNLPTAMWFLLFLDLWCLGEMFCYLGLIQLSCQESRENEFQIFSVS